MILVKIEYKSLSEIRQGVGLGTNTGGERMCGGERDGAGQGSAGLGRCGLGGRFEVGLIAKKRRKLKNRSDHEGTMNSDPAGVSLAPVMSLMLCPADFIVSPK